MLERSSLPGPRNARETVLHLLRQSRSSVPVAALGMADEYLRRNPQDAEVRTLRAGWRIPHREKSRAFAVRAAPASVAGALSGHGGRG